MANDVLLWCQSCELYASRKPGPGFGKSPLQSSPHQSAKPLYRIALNRNFRWFMLKLIMEVNTLLLLVIIFKMERTYRMLFQIILH